MSLEYASWESREGAHALADIGWAALAYCRAAKGIEGVASARYWTQKAGGIVILVETEPDKQWSTLAANPELGKALAGLLEIARNVEIQSWGDPRTAAQAMASAGIA